MSAPSLHIESTDSMISDMPFRKVYDQNTKYCICGFGAEVCIECVFQTLWVLNQRVHVEMDVVHLR